MNAAFASINYEALYYAGICVMVFFFGICIGSFLNVCILRLPRGESLVKRNSHCMTCGAEIKPYDLIPLFSWLFLGGKCRSCKAPISPRYSIVEGLTGILFVLVYLKCDIIKYGLAYPALICLFLAGVIVIGFEDWDTQEMSVCVLVYLGLLAFASRVLSVLMPTTFRGSTVSITEGLIGMFCVSVPLLIIGFVITPLVYILFISEDHKTVRKLKNRLRKNKLSDRDRAKLEKQVNEKLEAIKEAGPVYGFGMGDVLFMAAGGLMLGWKATIVAAFIAIFIGAIAAVIMKIIAAKKGNEMESAFAFGPYLAIGLGVAAYYGTEIFDMYWTAVTVPHIVL